MNRFKKTSRILMTLVTVLMAWPAMAATYDIDPSHSSVGFKVKHLAISNVSGGFGAFSGSFGFTPGNPDAWTCEATLEVASIDTGDEGRDEHLLGTDFFDVEQYPTMVFTFTGVQMESEEEGRLTGMLTMRGQTHPVTLDLEVNGVVTDPWNNERAGFSASGKINRKDWGLSYGSVMEGGGLVIGNDVKISLEIEGIKRK